MNKLKTGTRVRTRARRVFAVESGTDLEIINDNGTIYKAKVLSGPSTGISQFFPSEYKWDRYVDIIDESEVDE